MSEYLEVIDRDHAFAIGWFDDEEGLEGDLCLGEECNDKEHNVATEAAKTTHCRTGSSNVLLWDTMREAKGALQLARIAVKEYRTNKPWPDWAKTAVANGWKPPKGWTP
jgi:hypothetical protein